MALVNYDIDAIRNGVFGKDVREAIADALEHFSKGIGPLAVDGITVSDDNTGLTIIIRRQ